MSQYPYLKKAKMPSCKTVLCDICQKVHVPASKSKIRGKTVCVHCRGQKEKRLYDDQRYKNVGRPKGEQKKVLSEGEKSF